MSTNVNTTLSLRKCIRERKYWCF